MKKITLLFLLLPFLVLSQVQIGQDIDGDNASDQLGFDVSISENGNIIAIGIPSSDGNGDLTSSENIINTSKLSSGSYSVEILTNKGKSSKQLIKE